MARKKVRCSWEEITELENGLYKDFGHMKLYTSELSPRDVERMLNEYLKDRAPISRKNKK